MRGISLELAGRKLFESVGFTCAGELTNVRLSELDPTGPYSSGEHVEFDYLIPHGTMCLVGEITARRNKGNLKDKYSRFIQQTQLLGHIHGRKRTPAGRRELFRLLGVPDDQLPEFDSVSTFAGFFVTTHFDRATVTLDRRPGFAIIYKHDWMVFHEYAEAISRWAAPVLLERLGMPLVPVADEQVLQLRANQERLLCSIARRFSLIAPIDCNILLFETNPYLLLRRCRVYRRESLSQDLWDDSKHYQRALRKPKLRKIRKWLLDRHHDSFLFPGSILVVLDQCCSFDQHNHGGSLEIPDRYGAVHVVDGQHRLFAYADLAVENDMRDTARILVTALHIPNASAHRIKQCSAQAFVEINSNQTRVPALLLHDIAYDVLGKRDAKAISAKVLTEANRRKGRLRGFLRTNDTPYGIVKMTELVSVLSQMLNPEMIRKVALAITGNLGMRRFGYEALFAMSQGTFVANRLTEPDELVRRGIYVLVRYFNLIGKQFATDWAEARSSTPTSAFRRAHLFYGWVRLLKEFIDEGASWDDISMYIEQIHEHVGQLGGRAHPNVVFDESVSAIPNPKSYKAMDFYRFLSRNRTRKTRIQTAVRRA